MYHVALAGLQRPCLLRAKTSVRLFRPAVVEHVLVCEELPRDLPDKAIREVLNRVGSVTVGHGIESIGKRSVASR